MLKQIRSAAGDPSWLLAGHIGWAAEIRAHDSCNITQYLEVGLRAVDGRNLGFPRSDSLLAFLIIANTEDCSTADENLWKEELWFGKYVASARCYDPPAGMLHPIAHYVKRYAALQPGGRVLVHVVAKPGVPKVEAQHPGDPLDSQIMCGLTVHPVRPRLPRFVAELQQSAAPRAEGTLDDAICRVVGADADKALLGFADAILARVQR